MGTVLGERYRVVRLLGAGAFGSVLEVEHVHTRHHRALKLLHPEAAGNPEVVERFLREASAAGRVGNPHIVETFDAGRFPDGQPYLVMELLDGETLRALVHRERQLGVGLACELVAQAAEGIDAAHRAGIVHRDLKPDNLHLSGRRTLKILDFGVSRFTEPDDVSLTQSSTPMGTPSYMAPEIFAGAKDATPAVDVYALGVVLYELLCGWVPFEADSYGALAIQVATTTARPLAERLLEVDPRLEAVVGKAMARQPGERYASAQAFADALSPWRSTENSAPLARTAPSILSAQSPDQSTFRPPGKATPYEQSVAAPMSSPHEATFRPPAPAASDPHAATHLPQQRATDAAAPATPRRSPLALAGLAAVVLAVAGGGWLLRNRGQPAEDAVAADATITLLRSARKDDWKASLAAEVLHRSLGLTGAKLTPLAEAESFLAAQDAWPDGSPLEAGERERLAKAFGPSTVVSVEVVAAPPTLQVAVYLRASRRVLTQAITADDVTGAALALAPQLRALLSRPPPNPADEQALAGALPHAAAEQYQHGLEQLRVMNLRDARDSLEAAQKSDPKSALIQSALARAYDLSGYDARALSAAQQAAQLAESAPRSVQLEIACQVAALSWQPRAVEDSCGASALAYPDSLELKLGYAEALKRTGQWTKAEQVLRAGPEELRVLLSLCEVLSEQKNFEEELQLSRRVAQQATRGAAPWLAGAATLKECDALRGKRALPEAYGACEQARKLFIVARDLVGQARAQTELGHVLLLGRGLDAGIPDEGGTALEAYRAAVSLAKQAGSARDEVEALKYLADVQPEEEARRTLEEARAKAEEIGSAGALSLVTQALGSLAGQAERLEEALGWLQKALEAGRASHLKAREALALVGLGAIEAELGRLPAARGHLEQAVEVTRALGDQSAEEFGLETLADVLSELGEPQRAREALRAARALLAGRPPAEEVRVDVAQLRHDFEAGEPLALEQATTIVGRATDCDAAIATALAWLADPKQAAVAPKVTAAAASCEGSQALWVKLASAEAWLRAANRPQARRALDGAGKEAGGRGWVGLLLWSEWIDARLSAKPSEASAKVAAKAAGLGHLALAARAGAGPVDAGVKSP